MVSCKDIAEMWNVSDRAVSGLCKDGKIPGAMKVGRDWQIPADAVRPADNRIKSGAYRKKPISTLSMPIGVSDYKRAQADYYYVDKTLLIRDVLDRKAQVSLFTRPRRFGKTLNMDMLRVFFEISEEDTSVYFRDKKIWKYGEEYTSHQGKYPVIFLTFKDVKYDSWQAALDKISILLQAEFGRHRELFEDGTLADFERDYLNRIMSGTASEVELSASLENLSRMLHEYHKKAPIIIIDEYDTPIQEGYSQDYYEKIVGFMRNFFSGGFKDNPHLSFGFLTGILRIAQESIFSGLNNLDVNSVLDDAYSQYFGFTVREVGDMLGAYHAESSYGELCQWYDGYLFGSTEIFNPWSVICYISKKCVPQAYWANTGRNEILDEVLNVAAPDVLEKLEVLLQGETVAARIDMNVIYPSLKEDPANIYSLLLAAGYLKAVKGELLPTGSYLCQIEIPNKEIGAVYRNEILNHLIRCGAVKRSSAEKVAESIYMKDQEKLQNALAEYLDRTISYYDAGEESFFHGLTAGMLALMDDKYRIVSNREPGDGRFDIGLYPRTKQLPGILIEVKYGRNFGGEQLEKRAREALDQISEKRYDAELRNNGITNIVKYGIAFSGKQVRIVSESQS
ncbi:MAG: AAA family ATPase [Lachnospiraceae bacterium]|nr:AAA family ATPase [Lachnospiraceae bacterium]MCM1240010.1 AAA family ATPase [Lachnospiraceae bacterium]